MRDGNGRGHVTHDPATLASHDKVTITIAWYALAIGATLLAGGSPELGVTIASALFLIWRLGQP